MPASQLPLTDAMGDPSININSLPNELLLKIFSYLSEVDLGGTMQFVCSRWAELCFADVLWKGSSFSPEDNATFDYISAYLEKVPKLQRFEMTLSTAEILQKVAECCKDLRELVVSDIRQVGDIREVFGKLITECKNLEDITVPVDVLLDDAVVALVGQCARLRTITLTRSSRDQIKLKPIADGCPSLQCLHMGCVDWLYSDMKYFLEQKGNQLHSLKLIPFSRGGSCIFSLLTTCENNVRELQLAESLYVHEYYNWSNLNLINQLPSLVAFSIKVPLGLTADIMTNFFMDERMSKLQQLEITYCPDVNDTVIHSICKNCKNLLKLGLSFSYNLEDNGLMYLSMCSRLEELDISHCKLLTGNAMAHIVKCSTIKSLDIGHSGIDRGSLVFLRHMPQLRELKLFGYDIRELDLNIFPLYLKNLQKLILQTQKNIDFNAIAALRVKMPRLIVLLEVSYFYIKN